MLLWSFIEIAKKKKNWKKKQIEKNSILLDRVYLRGHLLPTIGQSTQ